MSREISHKGVTGDSYAGIPIHCERGVHEFVFAKLRDELALDSKILELGAGSGAMTQRLLDHGFANVDAVDVSAQGWSVPSVSLNIVNLNSTNWVDKLNASVDAILAVEIIEHLENPSTFLKQCTAALRPNGDMFLTTPNLVSIATTMYAIRKGEHLYFQRDAFYSTGHRSPILPATLLGIAEESNLEVIEVTTCGHMRGLSSLERRAISVARRLRNREVRHLDGPILYAHLKRK